MWHFNSIPKIVHMYWGNDTMSYLRYLTPYSICKYNTDWKVNIYRPKNITTKKSWTGPEGYEASITSKENYWDEVRKLPVNIIEVDDKFIGIHPENSEVHKSDALRWRVLRKDGGIWSDFDILYFRKFEDIYFNTSEYSNLEFSIAELEQSYVIGFVIASNKFALMDKCINKIDSKKAFPEYQWLGARLLNFNLGNPYSLKKCHDHNEVVIFNPELVYPCNCHHILDLTSSEEKSKDITIGVHWFGGSKDMVEYSKNYTKEQFLSCEGYLFNIIRKIINDVK